MKSHYMGESEYREMLAKQGWEPAKIEEMVAWQKKNGRCKNEATVDSHVSDGAGLWQDSSKRLGFV